MLVYVASLNYTHIDTADRLNRPIVTTLNVARRAEWTTNKLAAEGIDMKGFWFIFSSIITGGQSRGAGEQLLL